MITAPRPPSGTTVGRLASYIEEHRGGRCDEAVRDAALKCVFDLVGSAAAGFDDAGPAATRSAACELYGTGEVPIWFSGRRSTAVGAGWANGSAAAAMDLDDGNRWARGHPGAAIVPAAFAVGQEVGAGLEDILTAIVIGYEVGVTVGSARTTYGSSGTWTPYGVVAAAAALRDTPRPQIEHALAIAGESAPNQAFASAPAPRDPHPEGAAVKEGIPWGVVTGLTAVRLAEAGHTGPRNILDSGPHYRFPDGVAPGGDPHILRTYFKPYACCRHIHAPLAALLDLMSRNGIDGRGIETMAVDIHAAGLRISNKADPENSVDVQYSIPYVLALAALHGPETLMPVTAEALGMPEVVDLARRVSLSLDETFDAVYPETIVARVTIVSGGRRYVSEPTPPAGEPLMSWDELEQKFDLVTRKAMTEAQRRRMSDAVGALRAGMMEPLLECLAEPIGVR